MKAKISTNSKSIIVITLMAILSSLTLISLRTNAVSDEVLLQPKNTKLIETGREIYLQQCASCHGKNLEGQPDWQQRDEDGFLKAPPHNASGHTWHHTDKLLFELTKFGLAKISGLEDFKSNMPVYENILTDTEIIAVLSYIKSTWPEHIQNRHDQLNSQ